MLKIKTWPQLTRVYFLWFKNVKNDGRKVSKMKLKKSCKEFNALSSILKSKNICTLKVTK